MSTDKFWYLGGPIRVCFPLVLVLFAWKTLHSTILDAIRFVDSLPPSVNLLRNKCLRDCDTNDTIMIYIIIIIIIIGMVVVP
uniref:Uncharacterized protein n=1 Tax=Anopheles darlingi TaxID=43151 RepID=A0A2M4DPL3_ANODA